MAIARDNPYGAFNFLLEIAGVVDPGGSAAPADTLRGPGVVARART
jgi:hypothetical protein